MRSRGFAPNLLFIRVQLLEAFAAGLAPTF